MTDDEQAGFEVALQQSPDIVGYDAPAWNPKLACQYLLDEFSVEYALRHLLRLTMDAGVSRQTPRAQPPTADDGEREAFRKDLKILTQKIPEEYTTVVIEQTRKAVRCDLYRAWFPVGERIGLPYWRTYESVRLLGTITENGESFLTEVDDSFNSDVTVRMLRALRTEFGDKIHDVLDNAPYFTANKVEAIVDDSAVKLRISRRDRPS